MLVKTFQAGSMPEALKLVKAAFGSDAMILSSREGQRRRLMGFGKRAYAEVTAAYHPAERPAAEWPAAEEPEPACSAQEEFQKAMLVPIAREMKALKEQVDLLMRKGQEAKAEREPQPSPVRPEASAPERQHPEQESRVESFLQVLRDNSQVRRQEGLRQRPADGAVASSSPLERLSGLLTGNGVLPEVAAELLKPLSAAMAGDETEAMLKNRLRESIASHVTCTGSLKMREGGPRVLALIGPTGVGKTTTIAKLAAFAFKKGAKVALVTIDTFRVGAVEQLKTYSRIMGVPLEVATSPQELARVIDSHGDKDLIFIDTAGRSPRDLEHLRQMKEFLHSNPVIETHLCLAVTTRDRELEEAVRAFGDLPVDRVLFTKLDESSSFGCMANVLMKSRYPVSFFTTGQRVPEDVEVATVNKLTDLVLKGT